MWLEIININYQGDGYGIINNKKVCIPKTAIGDIVDFDIIKENKNFVIGQINKIIQKSPTRVEEINCNIYEKCGGCNLLHLKENIYQNFKKDIIKNALKKSGYESNEINLITIGFDSRRRATFQVKNNKLGFFEKNSNNLVEVNNCPLLNKNINDIILQLSVLIKKLLVDNISITNYENGLELLFTFRKELTLNENKILKDFVENNKNVIIASYKISNNEPSLFFQKTFPKIKFNNIEIELNSNIFIQATEEGQKAITNIVVESLKNCKKVLDLYCGIGTYTFPLSNYTKVHSIEGSQTMIEILNKNIKNNNLLGKITAESRNLVSSPLLKNELNKYDGVVINPPRNGAQSQSQQLAKSNIENVVMVSCNPETFSIDANELRLSGYKLINIVGIDQFYKTQHLEVVAVFKKNL